MATPILPKRIYIKPTANEMFFKKKDKINSYQKPLSHVAFMHEIVKLNLQEYIYTIMNHTGKTYTHFVIQCDRSF